MSYFDDRMLERAAEKAARKSPDILPPATAERELDDLQASTKAVQAGLSNGGLWLLLGVGIALAPYTFGASFLLSIAAAVKMSGGRLMITDALPKNVDVVAPGWGGARVLASLLSLALASVCVAFVLALVAFEMGWLG